MAETEASVNGVAVCIAAERGTPVAGERAMYFGNKRGERLFGVLNVPAAAGRIGAVFCHPIGEEKQKSYRAYAMFARYLSQAGVPCLRFDCYGFGDSAGDVVETTVVSQIEDTYAAIEHLCDSTGVSSIVLLGARFGATVAALAASGRADVAGLALFSPVVDGAAYWSHLLRTQQMSYMTRGMKPKKRGELLAGLAAKGYIEIDADFLSAACVEELCDVDLLENASAFDGRCLLTAVVSDHADCERAKVLAARYSDAGAIVTGTFVEARDFWTTQSLYDGYLPDELYERVAAWIAEIDS